MRCSLALVADGRGDDAHPGNHPTTSIMPKADHTQPSMTVPAKPFPCGADHRLEG